MSERSQRHTHLAVLILILALGAGLRLWGLGTWQWEEDELYTLRDAAELSLSRDGSPGIGARPVYYLLQHALLAIAPATAFFLRLPAFIFGTLGIVATWWLGRRMFGHSAGLVAALLVAVSPWHLQASQFARYWSLVFLLAALAYGLLARAIDRNSHRSLAAALLVLLAGALTHPTFLFPVAGVALALWVVAADGTLGFRWPTARAWLVLWGPFLGLLIAHYVIIKFTGHGNALRNSDPRGFLASVRLIPAMIQWTPLDLAVAGAVSTGFLLTREPAADRRFGAMVVGGVGIGLVLLLASSLFTSVYADYGIALLPLVYVVIGGAIQRVAEGLPPATGRWVVGGAATTLALATSPGTVSHLIDGSRFDYRAAYETISRLGPEWPVAGGIEVLQQAFAPELEVGRFGRPSARTTQQTGIWFVASFQRYGLREGGARLQQRMDTQCRRVAAWERMRLDYRVHRVELHWCGPDPIPSLRTQP